MRAVILLTLSFGMAWIAEPEEPVWELATSDTHLILGISNDRLAIRAIGGASQGGAWAVGPMPEFKTDIAPGETFLVPPAFVGCYEGDIDDGAYVLHQWILRYLRPPLPDDIPDPILAYNLYLDAGGAGAKEADVLRSAAFCNDLGFEAFMPDAMWFPECGDWRWDPARLIKAGMPDLLTEIHE